MKTQTLYKLQILSGLLFIISGLWIAWEFIDMFGYNNPFNFWSVIALIACGALATIFGILFANRVKEDPRAAVKSFNPKASIIILLIGLSFTCNGQTTFEKDFQEADSLVMSKGCDFIGSATVIDARVNICNENVTTNMLLEYKQECFNTVETIKFNDAWIIQSLDSLSLVDKLPNYASFDTAYIKKDDFGYYQLFVNTKHISHKTPSFPDFLNWIETRKNK